MEIININAVRTELANCEARAKALRGVIRCAEGVQGRFNGLIGVKLSPCQTGLTEAVRTIVEGSPLDALTTRQIRVILKNEGFDTKSRNFNSALSTTLTRLGDSGFLVIGKDAKGTRIYKRSKTTEAVI